MLDAFAVSVDGVFVPVPFNVQRVIAILAVRDRPLLRSNLSTTLWMDTTEDRAAANLRTAVWKTRQVLGDLLVVAGNHVALAAASDVDLGRAVRHARRLIRGDAMCDAECDGTDLRGDLLPDWDEDWILFERERFRQLRIHALEALCAQLSGQGRGGEAIDAGLAAVAAEPLRESAQRTLVAAHLREGNLSEARRQYQRYRELLWDALGIEPSPLMREMIGSATVAI
jgi:DNA-binding SARP family transcriptional activator